MKFYSEKLDQLFDTPEALADAEKASKKKTKKATASQETATDVATTETVKAPTKKELAAEVESAEEAVKAAYAEYETAKVQVEELSKAYLEEVDKILNPAKKKIKEAEQKRYDAIRNFNEQFGAYQVTYTGARAAEDMIRAINSLNARANRMFFDSFWR